MSSYMPQDVFNMCSVSAARYVDSDRMSIEEFVRIISDSYRKNYIDDDFEKDIVQAAHNIVGLMQTAFPENSISSPLLQMQFCIKNYHPNGKKKSFLQGQWFNRQRNPVPDRVSQCTANVMTFHFGTIAGTFPVAPKGWSL